LSEELQSDSLCKAKYDLGAISHGLAFDLDDIEPGISITPSPMVIELYRNVLKEKSECEDHSAGKPIDATYDGELGFDFNSEVSSTH